MIVMATGESLPLSVPSFAVHLHRFNDKPLWRCLFGWHRACGPSGSGDGCWSVSESVVICCYDWRIHLLDLVGRLHLRDEV